MGTQITKTGLVPKETDPKNWLSRYGKFSAQSGLGDSSPFSSDMADPVPDLNVLPGPQRGSTSISITPNAFTVFNDAVEKTGDADSGAPVTGTRKAAPAAFPWWILLVLGGLWWVSRDE
jgi:hypothetical protein